MERRIAIIGLIAAVAGTPASGQEPVLARLRKHVEILASPAFEGRRDAGAEKARAYLIDEFRQLALAPALRRLVRAADRGAGG